MIKIKHILFLVGIILSTAASFAQVSMVEDIRWSVPTVLPAAPGEVDQLGLAGVGGGVHNNALLIAGGANFPDLMPWHGGIKKYWNHIYVLLKDGGQEYQWSDRTFELPNPLAYSASATTDNGIMLIGGENEDGIQSSVYLLRWDLSRQEVITLPMPQLPLPLTNATAAVIDNRVYLAGGETEGGTSNGFYSLDLSAPTAWERLPDLPLAVSHAVSISQSNGEYPCFYLIGGRAQSPSGVSELFGTTFRFDPRKNQWDQLSDISDRNGNATTLSAATGVASGANYILLFGGDKGEIFSQIQRLDVAIAEATDEEEKQIHQAEKLQLVESHPGFSKNIYLYNTVTDSWTIADKLPSSPVTTFATQWGNDLLIPSGEIQPGVRTPDILKGYMEPQHYFAWQDYLVIVLYLLMMIGVGLWTSKNQLTTDDYFKGGQRIPGWAAGLSIYGTQLSAITFMAIPAKAYATDWSYFILQLTIIMVIPIITNYFIPFYRNLQITSAYEYLEERFSYLVRAMASLLYIMLQVGRLAIVLLLPSLALTLVTGINVNICILMMGLVTIFYTMKGGIEAVIWTDVIQVVILLGGALVCMVMIPLQLQDGPTEIWQTVQENNKLNIINLNFTFTEPTLWVVLLGGIAINVISYGADQTVVQRYLTTKDEKSAKKSMRLGAWLALPSSIIFFSIGTLLYLFFKENPDKVNYQLQSQDAIFPWYIVTELPAGVTGLLIAAVFAAAMGSLSSSLNSISTAVITDFYRRFTAKTEKNYLATAQLLTLFMGLIGTGLALVMAGWGIASLWDQFNIILGLFTGGLGGVFVLGIFTKKANTGGAVAGLLISGVTQYYISSYTDIHLLMYAFMGLVSCVVFGYLFSLLFGLSKKEIEGLTVYDQDNEHR